MWFVVLMILGCVGLLVWSPVPQETPEVAMIYVRLMDEYDVAEMEPLI